MSRIIEPESFVDQRLLFNAIFEKHTTDGTSSVLIPYLTQQGIDLAADNTAKGQATTHEGRRFLFSKQSENFRQLRDLHWDPVMGHQRKYYQYLKSFYKPNFMTLGEWGAPITATGKINYPPEFPELTEVFEALKTKYDSYDPDPSPLDPFLTEHTLSIASDWTEVSAAREYHTKFEQFARDSEDETQLRNNKWNPVLEHIQGIGNYLMKLYPNNTKKLGLWGFTVDDSKRAPKLQTSKVKPATQKTLNAVIVGGTLTNTGTVDLHVYKGKSTAGTPAIVHPNEKLGMTKGYSTVTVVNPSTTVEGKFTVLRSN